MDRSFAPRTWLAGATRPRAASARTVRAGAAALALGTAVSGGSVRAEGGCPERNEPVIAILVATLDAGIVTHESFRLSGDGTLSRAVWSDGDRLVSTSEAVELGSDAFARAEAVVADTRLSAPRPEGSEAGWMSWRPGVTFELVHRSARSVTRTDVGHRAAPSLDPLLARWREAAPSTAPAAAATYLWTLPAQDRRAGPSVGVSLCELPWARTVAHAAAGAHAVRLVPEGFNARLDGAASGRSRFTLDVDTASIPFGLVRTR